MPGIQDDLSPDERLAGTHRVASMHERAALCCMYASVLHQLGEKAGDKDMANKATKVRSKHTAQKHSFDL